MADITLEGEILQILENLIWSGTPDKPMATIHRTLDPETYAKVNRVLTILGGAYKTNKKGHVFDAQGRDNVEAAIDARLAPDLKKRRQA